jgi:hemin uptake protein HemP
LQPNPAQFFGKSFELLRIARIDVLATTGPPGLTHNLSQPSSQPESPHTMTFFGETIVNDQQLPPGERDKPTHDPSGVRSARVMSSEELLQGATELLISHGDDLYRLRLTRNGKLILHK